jgi:hypothetical protein
VWILLGIALPNCSSYSKDIGAGFIRRTRVYYGMAHEYREHDLYYRGFLGIRWLIYKDVSGGWVSPDGSKVLFFTRKSRPEPLGMEHILHVFNRQNKELLEIAGENPFTGSEYWSPKSDRFVFKKLYEPIMLFDLSAREYLEVVGPGHWFLGWSPSGEKIAYSTDKTIYEINTLYFVDLEDMRSIKVEDREGKWRIHDYRWIMKDGEETIVVKPKHTKAE